MVRTTLVAGPGIVDVAVADGKNWTVASSSAANIASFVVFLNLYYPQIDQG